MPASRLALLLLSAALSSPAVAADAADGAEQDPAAGQPLPDGFLEFLGMMVEQDGELIDPLSLEGADRDREPGATNADGAQADAQRVDDGTGTADAKTAEERQ